MKKLSASEKFSIKYHSNFSYPLTEKELVKWNSNYKNRISTKIFCSSGFYFVEGEEESVKLRRINERHSKKKIKIARKVGDLISKIPTVKVVALSGSLAMKNGDEQSDIDLLIITSADTLWITRPIVYLYLSLNGYKIRKPGDKNEKDKLCLNLWMDERDLSIDERNYYTAHELAQLEFLVNKDQIFECLLVNNCWIHDFWPNACRIKLDNTIKRESNTFLPLKYINKLAYGMQRYYMKPKMTIEKVSLTRAFFHPRNWASHLRI